MNKLSKKQQAVFAALKMLVFLFGTHACMFRVLGVLYELGSHLFTRESRRAFVSWCVVHVESVTY